MARFEDVLGRWLSWGGLVVAVACGNAIAALNWYSIARSFAYGDGADSLPGAAAEIAAQRYAFTAVMLLVVGLRLVDRRVARAS